MVIAGVEATDTLIPIYFQIGAKWFSDQRLKI